MIFFCKKNELTSVLTSVSKVISSKPSIPITSGCLCKAKNNNLIIEGTNLESGIKLQIPVIIEEEGEIVVPVKYLLELVKRLPEGNLYFQFNKNKQQLSIKTGTSIYHLNCWPADDFPCFTLSSQKEDIKFSSFIWKNTIKKLIFSSAAPEIRPNFSGVYFSFNQDTVIFVSTDTYRLSVLRLRIDLKKSLSNVMVPINTLYSIMRILEDEEDISIFWQNNLISFWNQRFIFASRIIDVNFPDYKQIIPKSFQLSVTLKKSELINVLERASLFCSASEQKSNHIIKLKVQEQILIITTDSSNIGSLYEEIQLSKTTGGECEVFFNSCFLLEPLRVMDSDEIVLEFNGSEGPLLYREETDNSSYLHLILPIRKVF